MLALQLLMGWLLADLLSGLLHWWQDQVLTENNRLFGWLKPPSILHHAKPLAFMEGGFWLRNWASWAAAGIVGLVLFVLAGLSPFMVAVMIGIAISTQAHYWAHRPSLAPSVVRMLQKTGILQSAKGHARHHRPPQANSYCILTDWLNPILNKVLWRKL